MHDPLDVLVADGVIDEVLGRLKSGKEATISLVRRGDHVFAAKVYKDRATRSFKNNTAYREGRKVRNSRTQRAMDGGGKFGREAAEQAWKSAEADALYKLLDRGVRIPTPLMFYEGVLLMDLVRGADGHPAPRMIDVAIERDAAIGVYADLVAQMISMLCCDLIHGDLSPYNILASADGPTIIDFPQVISAAHNSRAEFFFLRDFDNVVRFLAGFDPALAVHHADGRAIWRAYVSRALTPQFVPPPPPPPRPTRGPDRRWRPDDQGRPPRSDGRTPPPGNRGPQRSDGRTPPPGNRGPQRSDGRTPPPGNRGPLRFDGRTPPPGNRGPQRSGTPSRDPRADQGAPPSGTPSRDPRADQGAPRSGPPSRDPRADQGAPRSGPPSRDPRSQPRSDRPDAWRANSSPPPRWSPPSGTPAPSPSRGRRRRPKRHW